MLADAERPTQDPQKAAVIVVGWVNSISKTSQGESDYYTFWVNVESVESGSGVASGDLISVKTFQWARPGPGKVGGSGHAGRPVIGDKIRLYANPNGSGLVATIRIGLMCWSIRRDHRNRTLVKHGQPSN
jgi:hypothetical protein